MRCGLTERVKLAPTAGLMHVGLMLTGLGTALLGPILPLLARQWGLQDAQSGMLLLAQFCGAFTGGVMVAKDLRRSLLAGMAAACVGFGVFALAHGLGMACAGLFVGGFGCGQLITALNVLAGRRYMERRGSMLAALNFSWSFGAMLSPLLAAWLTPKFAVRSLLEVFAALFLLCGFWLAVQMSGTAEEAVQQGEAGGASGVYKGLGWTVFVYFGALLFLYGGMETSLSGWLTTYALRYGDKTLAVSESTTLLLWMALTVGRAGTSLLLLKFSDRIVQRVGLGLAAVFTAALARAHTTAGIAAFAVLLGLSMAPFFPTTFSLLIARRPTARQAGIVVAVSGLGAAALPWLMGVMSTRTGSLQAALVLPLGAAVVLLGMSLFGMQVAIESKTNAA